jgi:inactivated superfamily I helicase
MAFIQIMELTTKHFDEIDRLETEWLAATEGKRTLIREMACRDRSNPDRYVIVAEFASYEDAMRNSELPETAALAEKMAALTDGPIKFTDCDLVDMRS